MNEVLEVAKSCMYVRTVKFTLYECLMSCPIFRTETENVVIVQPNQTIKKKNHKQRSGLWYDVLIRASC